MALSLPYFVGDAGRPALSPNSPPPLPPAFPLLFPFPLLLLLLLLPFLVGEGGRECVMARSLWVNPERSLQCFLYDVCVCVCVCV